jgi:hypothetical protein
MSELFSKDLPDQPALPDLAIRCGLLSKPGTMRPVASGLLQRMSAAAGPAEGSGSRCPVRASKVGRHGGRRWCRIGGLGGFRKTDFPEPLLNLTR